jgi:hypothetical protein
VLSPPDNVISSDLSGASLHTNLDFNTQQCGFGFFPHLPLSIDMTPAGTGPVATTQSDSPSGCFATFFLDRATHATGSASLTFPPDPDGNRVTVPYSADPSSEIDSSDHTFRMSGSTPCTAG